jgi:Co/Zn/Cd efflux system component
VGGVGLVINVVGMLLFGSHGHAHGGEGGHAHGGEGGHAHTEDDGHAHGRDGGKGHGHSHAVGGEICSNEGFSFVGDDQDHGGMAAKKLADVAALKDHQSADLPAEKVNE